ncbi:protein MpNRPE1b [Marchantia polymorpha subsp. ruderalis]|uniref:DNA-directed RNA polymerase subunit n=2 Tax=Marchantia polymorpha TaxID=3197 RepID=A0AAF6BLZ5_MARPO|nr:hypothetical protein MARPO_0104s0044 [Marchantia polymorpha]PTQ32018.1 hypothetical protein MARPO_0104s0044 [Marchantia polymorpha]BBN13029.1 hypothetical protein Mp_6g00230 [Marchantia polymorpha subsp. ruderalis]BBN13030.1 hypothetical protein Mp_6g00230 [Marchantia polymorpha subsp. ruderalis]|eukprot:PTQ32017.1 hypothetical protein MARPO_0104s0044 [Marchantia polymorpha]
MEVSEVPPEGGTPQLAKICGIQFGLMTTANTLNMSVLVTREGSIRSKDPMNAYFGLPTPSGKCLTCNGVTVDECQGHFGHILLSLPIFHPNYVEALVTLLRRICLNCGQLRKKSKLSSYHESSLALLAGADHQAQSNLGTHSNYQSHEPKGTECNTSNPVHADIGMSSESNSRNKRKLEEALDEDIDDWPDGLKPCISPEEVIVLSSDDSDEDFSGKAKELQGMETNCKTGQVTKCASPGIPTSSRKMLRKRKTVSYTEELNCKSPESEFAVPSKGSGSKAYKRRRTSMESRQTEKSRVILSGDTVEPASKSVKFATKVCKYCSASSRRLGYPKPDINVHVNLKGASNEDPFNSVKFIKMSVKPKERENLAADYWDFVEGSSKLEKPLKRGSRYLLPSEALNILKKIPQKSITALGMKANIACPEAMILECLPVPPNCTRLQEDAFGKGGTNLGFKIGVDRATQAFERLVRKINIIKTSRFGKPSFQAAVVECCVLQALFQQYLREKGAPKTAPGKEKKKVDTSGRLQHRPTRWSLDWLKKNLIGKRSGFSARNVVTGDPYLSVEEIGVPMDIAKHVTYSERVTDFNRSRLQEYIDIGQDLGKSMACGAVRIIRKDERREVTRKTEIDLQTGDIVHRHLKDGDLVFVNRPPSLHKHSLLALKANIHSGATWTINPAICAPLHADFDGDCLHVFVPQTEESRAELHQLMTIPAQILPSPDENTILGLSQDYVLATYLVTSSPLFLPKDSMHQLAMWTKKQLPVPTIVKSPKLGPLWTGKQVIDLAIPEGFSFQSNNGATRIHDGEILSCGEKSNWLASTKGLVRIIAQKNTDAAVEHIDCSQAVLREWLLSQGFSVSLEDFYAAPDQDMRRKLKYKIEDNLEHAQCMFVCRGDKKILNINTSSNASMSILDSAAPSERRRRRHGLEDAAISSFRQTQSQIGETFIESISDSNCLLTMVRSGSKGSNLKVMQQIGSLGFQVIKGEELLSTHKNPKLVRLAASMGYSMENDLQDIWEIRGLVKSSLLDGLEPHEFFVHAISVRDGLFRQSLDIAEPGELFKRLMLFLRDIHIAYDGTVRNMGGLEIIQFEYDGGKCMTQDSENKNTLSNKTVMPGDAVGILAATAISQPAYQVMLEATQCLASRKIRPLELLQESLFPRSTSKLKESDRVSILRLHRCKSDGKYCEERRVLKLQDELQPVTMEILATETAIAYSSDSSEQWEGLDCAATELKQTEFFPWVGHVQLDKMVLTEKKISQEMILDRLHSKVKIHKSVSRKFRIGNIVFCIRDSCTCDMNIYQETVKLRQKEVVGPCLHFLLTRSTRGKVRSIKTVKEVSNETVELLEVLQNFIIPEILKTVVKGSEKLQSVNILWEDATWSPPVKSEENDSNVMKSGRGELVLEVTVKELYSQSRGMPWRTVQESCIQFVDYVDWQRSSPYSIQEIKSVLGVDAARDVLLQRLELAAGNSIGNKHLKLVADFMVYSGEVQGLTSYGYRDWMRSLKFSSPFTAGAFRAPIKHFLEAGRKGATERFSGVLASSVFGKKVPLGTGAVFDLNLNMETKFTSSSSTNLNSEGSAESDPGGSVDVLARLIELNTEIGVQDLSAKSEVDTYDGNNSCQVIEWGSSPGISKSEGVWDVKNNGPAKTAVDPRNRGDDQNNDAWGTSDNIPQWGAGVAGRDWPSVETLDPWGQ